MVLDLHCLPSVDDLDAADGPMAPRRPMISAAIRAPRTHVLETAGAGRSCSITSRSAFPGSRTPCRSWWVSWAAVRRAAASRAPSRSASGTSAPASSRCSSRPAPPGGFMHRFLERRGPGVHHVTFEVPDIDAACAQGGVDRVRRGGARRLRPGVERGVPAPQDLDGDRGADGAGPPCRGRRTGAAHRRAGARRSRPRCTGHRADRTAAPKRRASRARASSGATCSPARSHDRRRARSPLAGLADAAAWCGAAAPTARKDRWRSRSRACGLCWCRWARTRSRRSVRDRRHHRAAAARRRSASRRQRARCRVARQRTRPTTRATFSTPTHWSSRTRSGRERAALRAWWIPRPPRAVFGAERRVLRA